MYSTPKSQTLWQYMAGTCWNSGLKIRRATFSPFLMFLNHIEVVTNYRMHESQCMTLIFSAAPPPQQKKNFALLTSKPLATTSRKVFISLWCFVALHISPPDFSDLQPGHESFNTTKMEQGKKQSSPAFQYGCSQCSPKKYLSRKCSVPIQIIRELQ